MIEIVFSAVLYYLLFFATIAALRPVNRQAILFSGLYFILLLVLAVSNFQFGLIEQKFASTFAFERFQGIHTHFNDNFLFQAWVSSLSFALTQSWQAAIGVNLALVAALFLFVDKLRFVYALIFLSPAVVHISIFALRDVIMAVSVFIFCLVVLAPSRPKIGLGLLVTVALFMQRPELAVVIGLALGLFYFREFSLLLKTVLVVFLLGVIVFLLPQIPVVLGLPPASSIFALPDILLTFSEARADRWIGTEGADTAMLEGRLSSVPFMLRYPLQIFAFFLSPLPMDFKGATSAVFFLDSLAFLFIFRLFWRHANRAHRIFFMIYVLTSAFFMANYGNMFRVRMPCFLIMFSGLLTFYEGQARTRLEQGRKYLAQRSIQPVE